MLGLIVNRQEACEMEYLIKRELDELLFDLEDNERLNHIVKRSMEERYRILYSLFKRVAPSEECLKYMRSTRKH
jgi:hypothetical protein